MILWIGAALAATVELRADGPATVSNGRAERAVIVEGVWTSGASAPTTLPTPTSDGRDDTWRSESLRREQAGGRVRLTQRHVLAGAPGPRIVEPVCTDASTCSDALYLDLGPTPPPAGMQDILEPAPPPAPLPWGWIAAGMVGVVTLAGAAWLWRRRRSAPKPEAPPPEPAHILAWRLWQALRADTSLDDEARALALSELFRDYVAACLAIPARSLSTSEVLEALRARPALRPAHLQSAERLLRATDRVKYADDRPGADRFAVFDDDLRTFIDATKPIVEGPR